VCVGVSVAVVRARGRLRVEFLGEVISDDEYVELGVCGDGVKWTVSIGIKALTS
jgi:hypothetical protein